jgi:hypothetical protein
MKAIIIFLSFVYGLAAVYALYMAAINIYVYVANTNLGHIQSLKSPLLYGIGGLLLAGLTFLGYNMYKPGEASVLLKVLFYIPFAAVVLYLGWAILLLFSSGGKWN